MKFIDKIVNPAHIGLEYKFLGLNQPIEDSIKDKIVGMIVDLALSTENISNPLSYILKKGNLGKSIVKIFIIEKDKKQLIKEVAHVGEVPGSEGLNPI